MGITHTSTTERDRLKPFPAIPDRVVGSTAAIRPRCRVAND